MNESDLENELRALRPAAPSAALETRIANDLAALSARVPVAPARARESLLGQILRPLLWASVGATAAVVVMTARPTPRENLPTPIAKLPLRAEAEFSLPETSHELLAAERSAVRYMADRGPVREVRASYLEHHAWTNPRTGWRVEIAVPRRDVFLQPIAMQ